MQEKDKINGETNIWNQLRFRYAPYWPLFIFLLVCCLTGAWLFLKLTLPQYESTATLLIKDEKKGIDDSKLIESLNLISTKKIVENELEVIKSRSLMSEVVLNLGLYAPVFQKAEWVDHPAYGNSPVKIELRNPENLTEVKKVPFIFNVASSTVKIGNVSYPCDQWVHTPYGQIRFNRVTRDIKTEGSYYFSLIDPKRITLDLIKKLDASSASKLSSVINISIRDEVPARGEDVLNELILAYNRAAVNDKNALAVNTLAFIEERLGFVSRQLDSIERRLQEYKSNRGAVDISSQGKLFLENVSMNDQKVSDVNMQLGVLDEVESYVLSGDKSGGIVPSTLGISDPVLSELLNKLFDAEMQSAKLRKTVAENNPMLAAVTDQIEKIKPKILENIRSQRRSLQVSRSNLYATNTAYTSLLQAIPQKERDLVEISRQQNIQANIYSFLLQRREEAALSYSSSVADNRVVDRAQSSLIPVSPNKKLIYILALILTIILGVAIVSGRELFSNKVLYRHEIESLTRLLVLGEIGFNKSKDPIVLGEGKSGFVAEQFRKLRATLSFIGINNRHKKLLITSSLPGEGKSFVTANLGLSLALSGKKVVLVEFDLSNPTLLEKLNMENGKGLSDYLNGDAEPEEVIKRTSVHEHLFIIGAGDLPHNPSELIMGERVSELLSYLEKIFDYVIIDTAPVGALSDAYILSPMCDATLYIVRHRHTPKIVVARLDASNKINELKNAAIIFNGVRSRGFGKDSYGYGYGYVYRQPARKLKRTELKNA